MEKIISKWTIPIIGMVLCVSFVVLLSCFISQYNKMILITQGQNELLQRLVDQDNDKIKAQKLVEQDDINRWKTNISDTVILQGRDIVDIKDQIAILRNEMMQGKPFQSISGVPNPPKLMWEIIISAVDSQSDDGRVTSGRTLAKFNDIDQAIQYLEKLK